MDSNHRPPLATAVHPQRAATARSLGSALLLASLMGTALLVPTALCAAPQRASSLQTLTESELAAVHGQGEVAGAARQVPSAPRLASAAGDTPAAQVQPLDLSSQNAQAQTTLKVLQEVGKLLHPQGKILQAHITMDDVVLDTADRATIVNPDGGVTFMLPKTIGHVHVQDVRLTGSSGPGFGNIDIRGIDLRGTRVSVRSF